MKMKIVISFGVDDHNDDEPMQAVVEVAEVDRYRMMVNMMMLMGMLMMTIMMMAMMNLCKQLWRWQKLTA